VYAYPCLFFINVSILFVLRSFLCVHATMHVHAHAYDVYEYRISLCVNTYDQAQQAKRESEVADGMAAMQRGVEEKLVQMQKQQVCAKSVCFSLCVISLVC
jgi:hypothetical protein